jgi:glutathione S-transferase
MWTLYDFLASGNGYKVRFALRELGRPFVYRQVDILRGETREPWFLAKNPVGQVPVLELDDGTCLNESTAILFYVADGTPLLPSDALERTRVLQWLCFEQQNVDNVIARAVSAGLSRRGADAARRVRAVDAAGHARFADRRPALARPSLFRG